MNKFIWGISVVAALLVTNTTFADTNNNEIVVETEVSVTQDWAKVLDLIFSNHTVSENVKTSNVFYTHSVVSPNDPTQNRIASYISIVGYEFDEKIMVSHIEVVWEDWKKLPDGNWEFESWSFHIDNQGNFVEGSHDVITKHNVRTHTLKTIPTEEEAFRAKWEELKKEWIAKANQ